MLTWHLPGHPPVQLWRARDRQSSSREARVSGDLNGFSCFLLWGLSGFVVFRVMCFFYFCSNVFLLFCFKCVLFGSFVVVLESSVVFCCLSFARPCFGSFFLLDAFWWFLVVVVCLTTWLWLKKNTRKVRFLCNPVFFWHIRRFQVCPGSWWNRTRLSVCLLAYIDQTSIIFLLGTKLVNW